MRTILEDGIPWFLILCGTVLCMQAGSCIREFQGEDNKVRKTCIEQGRTWIDDKCLTVQP